MSRNEIWNLYHWARYSQALYSAAAALDGFTALEEERKLLESKAMQYDELVDRMLKAEYGSDIYDALE